MKNAQKLKNKKTKEAAVIYRNNNRVLLTDEQGLII